MTELLFKEEVFKIVGAAIEVHRELGSGFLEPVYQEAMAIELASSSIPFEAQKALQITYKGQISRKSMFRISSSTNKLLWSLRPLLNSAASRRPKL